MPAIDIVSMRGEMPRVLPHMLPDDYAALAQNCHFRFGVITPVSDDGKSGVTFDINPETLFLYSQNKWFTWRGMVDVVRSPVAQDPWGRVYYTDGQYPKVTSAQIATSGSRPYPTTSYRLGVPAPESAITCTVFSPPVAPVSQDVPPEQAPTPDESAGTIAKTMIDVVSGYIHKTAGDNASNSALQEQEDDPTDNETRFYTQTFVTGYGEEGPPGPQSLELTVKKAAPLI